MELLHTYLAKLIHAHFEYFIIAACIDLVLEEKFFSKRKLLFFPFIILGVSCNVLIPNHSIGVPLGMVGGITAYIIYIKDTPINSCILYFLVLMLHTLIQIFLFMWLPQSLLTNFWFLIFAFIIIYVVSYPFVKAKWFKKLYKILTQKNIVITIIFFNIAFVVMMHNAYYSIDQNAYYAKVVAITAIIIFGICANSYCIYNHIKKQKQQALLDAYNIWLPIVEQLISQIRTIQHNYDNELQTFKALPLVYHNVDDLKIAIMDYIKKIIDEDIPLKITLDYIPNEEMKQCIKELRGNIQEINNTCTITYNN